MKSYIHILVLMLTVAGWTACKDGKDSRSVHEVALQMQLTLPLEAIDLDDASDEAAQMRTTRVAGDPGLAEFFERPRHLALFLALGDPTTPSANPVYFYSIPCSQSDWTRSADSLVFEGSFMQTVTWDVDPDAQLTATSQLRAYMVASFDEFTTDPVVSVDNYHRITNSGFSELALLDMQFYAMSTDNDYSAMSLRDIYSTPYNLQDDSYQPITAEDRTGYYGTVDDLAVTGDAAVITIDDTLYHTAAKVDFQWNTAERAQANVMVSSTLNNAPQRGYLFRPAETISGVSTYSKVLLRGGSVTADDLNQNHEARYADATEVNVGNQWSGRAYTYILQPGDLDYSITTSEGGTTTTTAVRPASNDKTNEIFAAWYKLNFNIKSAQ